MQTCMFRSIRDPFDARSLILELDRLLSLPAQCHLLVLPSAGALSFLAPRDEWNAPRGSLTYDLTAMKIATKSFLLQRSAVGGSFLTPLRRCDH